MTGRIEGAELCHRIDAAKQLVKYGSKDAAEFIAKYKGVPCGHSINGRPDPADPCSVEERSLVAVTLNAPPTLTRDFLTVLSGIDEFLMARLIRAQTADGGTIIEFLDDVMQDRTDGFKTHHRIAAAKELIVHIVRDEQPAPTPSTTPSPSTGEGGACPESPRRSEGDSPVVGADPRVRPLPGSQTPSPLTTPSPSTRETDKRGDSPAVGADPRVRPLPGSQTPSPLTGEGWGEGDSSVVPAQSLPRTRYGAGTQGGGGGRSTAANPAHPEPSSTVIPAKSLPRTRYGAGIQGGGGGRNTPANPARTEPVLSTAEGSERVAGSVHPEPNSSVVPAEAGTQGGGGGRNTPANPARTEPVLSTAEGSAHPEPNSSVVPTKEPAPVELTIAERRINEKLEQHWHEPDPWTGPIDSTHPGRSPPW